MVNIKVSTVVTSHKGLSPSLRVGSVMLSCFRLKPGQLWSDRSSKTQILSIVLIVHRDLTIFNTWMLDMCVKASPTSLFYWDSYQRRFDQNALTILLLARTLCDAQLVIFNFFSSNYEVCERDYQLFTCMKSCNQIWALMDGDNYISCIFENAHACGQTL